jgi:photosystem II S4 domain protein
MPLRETMAAGSPLALALEPVVAAADAALRTWQPVWTGFLSAAVREEAEIRLGALSELSLNSDGGYAGSERRQLLLQRTEAFVPAQEQPPPVMGLEIAGNFLFDPAAAADFRQALVSAGAQDDQIGDLWPRGDRGAQAIVGAELAQKLDGREGLVRTVAVRFEARPLAEMALPAPRPQRDLHTVEASQRLDAVASAGFGLSRNRMATLIREGSVRIDWKVVTSPSRELAVGERVQLEGRGELRVEGVSETKRGRWRIQLIRS